MDKLELAKAKRRFKETYEYAKESVERGEPYPVPSCFEEDGFGTDPAMVPHSVFGLVKAAEESKDGDLIEWLAAFDLVPLVQYCNAFKAQAHPFGDMISDIEYLTEDLKDFHAWLEETRVGGQVLENICRDDEEACPTDEAHQERKEGTGGDEAHQEEARGFARLFLEGGENEVNIKRAREILEHIRPLGNAGIAHYLCDCMTVLETINKDIQKKALHCWLKSHEYNVAGDNAFSKAFQPTKP